MQQENQGGQGTEDETNTGGQGTENENNAGGDSSTEAGEDSAGEGEGGENAE